jgi:hypothetical protein
MKRRIIDKEDNYVVLEYVKKDKPISKKNKLNNQSKNIYEFIL